VQGTRMRPRRPGFLRACLGSRLHNSATPDVPIGRARQDASGDVRCVRLCAEQHCAMTRCSRSSRSTGRLADGAAWHSLTPDGGFALRFLCPN
jgi:hypothetical protein